MTVGVPESPSAGAVTPVEEEVEEQPSRRRWVIFGIAMTAMVMMSLDQSIVSTALPTLSKSLHAPINWTSWTVTAYQFGLVISLPIAGRISDQFGRKRVFLVCLSLFTVSSLLCASTHSIYLLIIFRALQAIGGGAFNPSAIGFLADNFGKNRDRAVAMTASVVPIGSLSGPVLGGVIVAYWSWRGVFLINLPIGVIVFLLAVKYIPNTQPKEVPQPDFKGIAILAVTLLSLMLGITSAGDQTAIPILQIGLPFLVAACCGAAFYRHAKSTPNAIVPVRFLRGGGFGRLNIINILYGGSALGIGVVMPLYAETRYGFTSLQAGTVLSARAFGVLTVGGLSAFLIRRVGYKRLMLTGFSVATVGMIILSLKAHVSVYAWLAVGAAIMGIGNGFAAPATNNAMLHQAPNEAGSISGFRQMCRQFGAITVVSLTTAIVSHSAHEGLALGHIYFVLGVLIIIVIIPTTLGLKDHRGRW